MRHIPDGKLMELANGARQLGNKVLLGEVEAEQRRRQHHSNERNDRRLRHILSPDVHTLALDDLRRMAVLGLLPRDLVDAEIKRRYTPLPSPTSLWSGPRPKAG